VLSESSSPSYTAKKSCQLEDATIPPDIHFGGSMPKPMKARLTQPLIRENGSHRPATWDEAMDRVVAAFRKSIEKNDPRDFGMFSCSKTVNELNYAAQKFVRSIMGTNNIDSCNRT
jgi:predicted molibdopterin-dependent oxidoreductase YjgC